MRYDVTIKMEMRHTLAVEASSPQEAQLIAMTDAANRDPEQMHVTVEVERGVQ